jgi:hypothetical protein
MARADPDELGPMPAKNFMDLMTVVFGHIAEARRLVEECLREVCIEAGLTRPAIFTLRQS